MKPLTLSKDCPRWLYEALREFEDDIRGQSQQLAAVDRGEAPISGGLPLSAVMDHGLLLGLTPDDDHPQYALLRGRVGGQTLHGSINSGGTGTFSDGGAFTQQVLGATSANTWTVSIDHSVAAGALATLIIGTGGNDGNPTATHNSITDTQGNTWTKVDQKSFDRGNVGAPERFISVSIWFSKLTTALTQSVDTLLVSFSGNVANKSCEGRWFNVTSGATVSVASTTTGSTDQNSPANPLVDLTISSLSSAQYLFIRADAIADNNTAYTASGSFTEFYSGHTSSTTSNGTLYVNVGTRGEFDIATNTGLTATGPTINLTNLPIAASMMVALQLTGGTPGSLILESGDDSLSSIINMNGSTITAHFDFFNFEAIGGSSVLSYIRGSDGAFVGPVVMSPAVHLLNTSLFDDVTASAVSRGALITGQTGTPKWTKLTVGTVDQYLGTDGTDVIWRAQSTIIHASLGGLSSDDHTQYLLLAGRTGGQVIGAGAHTSGNNTDLVTEGRMMLGDGLSGVNYTTGRVLDIRSSVANAGTHINIQPVLTGLSGAASGTLTGLQVAMAGTPGYTSGSFIERGFFFTATIAVPSGVTLNEGLGGLFQTALGTVSGTSTKITGLRVTTLGSTGSSSLTTQLGFDIQLSNRSSNVTNLSALNFSLNTTLSGTITTFKLIDSANIGSTALGDSANVTTWSGLFIPTLANPGTIWLLDLGVNNSRLAGKTRFGGTTTPTNPVSITGAADISGIFDFAAAPRLANGIWLTAFNSIAGTVNLLRYTSGNNTELNSSNSIDFIAAGGGSFRFTATTGIVDMTLAGGGILLKAGTTTAYPIRFQSGTNLTAATSGVLEYDGTFFYATEGTPTRRKIVLADGAAAGSIIYGDSSGNHFLKLTNGSALQVLASGGGTAAPSWATLDNTYIADRTRYWWVNSTMLQSSPAQAERGSGAGVYTGILINGTTDSEVSGWFVVPNDFVSLTSVQIAWASTGTSTNNAVWRLGYKVQVAADDLTITLSTADTTVTPTSTADILFLTTLTLPSVTLTAGSLVRITLQRRALNDAGDTNTDSFLFAGFKFTYVADM